MAASPAGWHSGPYGTHELRYFDGTAWTEHISDQGRTGSAPAAFVPAAPPAAPQPPPLPQPGGGYSGATTAPTRPGPALMSYSVPARIGVFVGAGLLILGSFLPWVQASFAFITFEKNGMDGDGPFTLILGVAAVLLFSLVRGAAGRVLTLVAAVLAAAVTFYDVVDVQRLADEVTTSAGSVSVDASVGIGLWICAIGALVLIAGVMVAFGEAMSKARS